MKVKKHIVFDKRAEKEINALPHVVRIEVKILLTKLSKNGNLIEPYGKKLNSELFEIRIKYKGQWRLIYAYTYRDTIVVLSAFHKKTQKTPLYEIEKAMVRLRRYQYENEK